SLRESGGGRRRGRANEVCPICGLFVLRTSCGGSARSLDSLGRRARSASRTKPSPRAVGGSRRSTRTVDESEIDSANKGAPHGAPLYLATVPAKPPRPLGGIASDALEPLAGLLCFSSDSVLRVPGDAKRLGLPG